MRCNIESLERDITIGDLILYRNNKFIGKNKDRKCLIVFKSIRTLIVELLDIESMDIIAEFKNVKDIIKDPNYIKLVCKGEELELKRIEELTS